MTPLLLTVRWRLTNSPRLVFLAPPMRAETLPHEPVRSIRERQQPGMEPSCACGWLGRGAHATRWLRSAALHHAAAGTSGAVSQPAEPPDPPGSQTDAPHAAAAAALRPREAPGKDSGD